MSRYTEKDLRNSVANFNETLEEAGSPWHLIVEPRNGYCAVDCKKVGACFAVGSGTPRECWQVANRWVIAECQHQKFRQLRDKLTALSVALTTNEQRSLIQAVFALLPE